MVMICITKCYCYNHFILVLFQDVLSCTYCIFWSPVSFTFVLIHGVDVNIHDTRMICVLTEMFLLHQDYLKKMTPPLREIESTPVRQHMFGNPFKIDKVSTSCPSCGCPVSLIVVILCSVKIFFFYIFGSTAKDGKI